MDYYTHYIQSNPEWSFVEVYADEGLSGTNTKKRRNFNRMIDDALAGKIDRIVTNRWLGLPIFAVVMFIGYLFEMFRRRSEKK